MNNQLETPYWKAMELQPLNLDEIPEVLRPFAYPEEQKNGVFCRKTIFTSAVGINSASKSNATTFLAVTG